MTTRKLIEWLTRLLSGLNSLSVHRRARPTASDRSIAEIVFPCILTSFVYSYNQWTELPRKESFGSCCSVSIRLSAITACIDLFGHGWAVVMTSVREVKSASLERL